MRKDLHRVIYERKKIRHTVCKKRPHYRLKSNHRSFEDAPSVVSMSPSRNFGDWSEPHPIKYNILENWLAKQVDKPWDLVYSEIRATNDYRNFAQAQIIESLDWLVEKNPVFIDGVPYHSSACYNYWREITKFYVYNGLLCAAEHVKYRRPPIKPEDVDYVSCGSPKYHYIKENGIWYWVEEWNKPIKYVDWGAYDKGEYKTYWATVPSRKKRQLGKREKKELIKWIYRGALNEIPINGDDRSTFRIRVAKEMRK